MKSMFSNNMSVYQIIAGEKLNILQGHGQYRERIFTQYIGLSHENDSSTLKIETKKSKVSVGKVTLQIWNSPVEDVLGMYTDADGNDYYIYSIALSNAYLDNGLLVGTELSFVIRNIFAVDNVFTDTGVTLSNFLDNGQVRRDREIIVAKAGEFIKERETLNIGEYPSHNCIKVKTMNLSKGIHLYHGSLNGLTSSLYMGGLSTYTTYRLNLIKEKGLQSVHLYDTKEQLYHFIRANCPIQVLENIHLDPKQSENVTEYKLTYSPN